VFHQKPFKALNKGGERFQLALSDNCYFSYLLRKLWIEALAPAGKYAIVLWNRRGNAVHGNLRPGISAGL
jgi:hypothetical protein